MGQKNQQKAQMVHMCTMGVLVVVLSTLLSRTNASAIFKKLTQTETNRVQSSREVVCPIKGRVRWPHLHLIIRFLLFFSYTT